MTTEIYIIILVSIMFGVINHLQNRHAELVKLTHEQRFKSIERTLDYHYGMLANHDRHLARIGKKERATDDK